MINWGILGFGGMGIRFAEAIKETSNSKLLSTASKSGKTFEDFKNQTYEDVINYCLGSSSYSFKTCNRILENPKSFHIWYLALETLNGLHFASFPNLNIEEITRPLGFIIADLSIFVF